MTKNEQALLCLLRISVSGDKHAIPQNVDWHALIDISGTQGILAVEFDAINKFSTENRPDMDTLMDWLGQVSYMESLYDAHKTIIDKLAGFYNENGIRMMLLRLWTFSLLF